MSKINFEKPPAMGKTDTSAEAAKRIAVQLPDRRREVMKAIAEQSGTGDDLAHRLRLSVLMVRPRLTELQDMGLVRDTGMRKKNRFGNSEIIWQPTALGREVAGELRQYDATRATVHAFHKKATHTTPHESKEAA